jgi:hypothetical protein
MRDLAREIAQLFPPIDRIVRERDTLRAKLAAIPPFVPVTRPPHMSEPNESGFFERLKSHQNADVLEMGTKRAINNPPTVRRHMAHPTAKYIATDHQEGLDVDVVADAENYAEVFGKNRFDYVLSCARCTSTLPAHGSLPNRSRRF